MLLLTRLTLWLIALAFVFRASAASFDCAKASTPQQKAICADPRLSKLDDDVAAAYRVVRAQLSPAGAAKTQQDQRAWLAWLRQVCPKRKDQRPSVPDCLKARYSERLADLQSGLRRIGGVTFFSRLKVMIAPDLEPPIPNTSDPGFGVGMFSWPEIDRPTPRQAAWNAAVRKQAAAAAVNPESGRAPPGDFEPESVAGADVSVVYRLKAVNERLIVMTMENETYGYGAAHPNEFAVAFHWWLQSGRALIADDVFTPGSEWKAFLAKRCYQKLTASEHKDDLYDEQVVRRALAESIKSVGNWIIDTRKFEIDFPEYSVAPRVAGFVSVELTWDELRPYLAHTFDPAGLPEPLPIQSRQVPPPELGSRK